MAEIIEFDRYAGNRESYRRLRRELAANVGVAHHWPEGAGAAARPEDIEAARVFSLLIEAERLPVPSPSFRFDGSVGFYWDRPGFYGDLTFSEGRITYLIDSASGDVEGVEEFSGGEIPPCLMATLKGVVAERRA